MKKIILSAILALSVVFTASAKNIINLGLNFGGEYTQATAKTNNILGEIKSSQNNDMFKTGLYLGADYAFEIFDGWGPHLGFLTNLGWGVNNIRLYTTQNGTRLSNSNTNAFTVLGFAGIGPEIGLSYYRKNLFQASFIPFYYEALDFSYHYDIGSKTERADVKIKNYKFGFRLSAQLGTSKCRNGFNAQIMIPWNSVITTETLNTADQVSSGNLHAFSAFEFSVGYKMSFVW